MLVTKGLNCHIYESVFSHTPYPICLIMLMNWPTSTEEAAEISLYVSVKFQFQTFSSNSRMDE